MAARSRFQVLAATYKGRVITTAPRSSPSLYRFHAYPAPFAYAINISAKRAGAVCPALESFAELRGFAFDRQISLRPGVEAAMY